MKNEMCPKSGTLICEIFKQTMVIKKYMLESKDAEIVKFSVLNQLLIKLQILISHKDKFKHGGFPEGPAGIIVTPNSSSGLNEKQIQELKKLWDNSYTGKQKGAE